MNVRQQGLDPANVHRKSPDKSTPVARRGRKARSLYMEIVRLPKVSTRRERAVPMTTSLDRQTRPHLRLIRQEEPQMAMSMSTHDSPAPMPAREPNVLYAPERLVAESRTEFRKS